MKKFELIIYFDNKISENARVTYTHPLRSEFDEKRDAKKCAKEIIDDSIKRIVLLDREKKTQTELYMSEKELKIWKY